MAVTGSRISDGSSHDVFCDLSWNRPQFSRRGGHPRSVGLPTTGNPDCRIDKGAKPWKASRQDIETLARIIRPVIKKQAKTEAIRILRQFGTIRQLFQSVGDLNTIPDGLNYKAIDYLKVVAHSFNYALEQDLLSGPVLSASKTLRNYLFHTLSSSKREMFRVLFLDTNNRLIEDRLMGIGTVNRIQVYVREIVRDAFELNATALILVHNHPCGDASPSATDITLTEKIIDLCHAFELDVLDHIIVSRSGIASFANLGILQGSQSPPITESKLLNTGESFVQNCINSILKTLGKK